MQVRVAIIVSVLIMVIGALVAPSFIERTKPRAAHQGFLEKLLAENYEHAFDFIAYHEGNPAEEPSISYEEARDIWVKRMEEFSDQGYLFSSYWDDKVWWEGDQPYGIALLTVRNDDKGEEFTVHFQFVKRDKWLISEMYVLENKEEFEYVSNVLTPNISK